MCGRGGFWDTTKRLFQERHLTDYSALDWTKSRTSGKYLATAFFVELLFAATFGYYAFGDVDHGAQCYGQTVVLNKNTQALKQVTSFTVDGNDNVNIAAEF